MTQAVKTRRIQRVERHSIHSRDDTIAVEEPLEIRIGERPLVVTMRTPGHDFELTAGFLFTEGIIEKKTDLLDLRHCVEKAGTRVLARPDQNNIVTARLARSVKLDTARTTRNFFATSACGICGKATLDAIRVTSPPLRDRFRVPLKFLFTLDAKLRAAQSVFQRTGALHAAALFDAAGKLLLLREDVGRHNAVDKVIGASLLDRKLPLDRHILMVSGRAGFEILQKALRAQIPIVAAVGGPSSLAVELAEDFGMTLVGFLRGKRCNIYSGEKRLANHTKIRA